MKQQESTQHKTGSGIFSFGLLFLGLVFLCNPNVNLFDVLPDAVGYGLLMLALRHASEVFPHFDDAESGFTKLFWINLAKIPATILMMYIAGIDMEERGMITVFAFGFAVLEWFFAIPAFRAMFEGFTLLGEREGVYAAFRVKGKGRDVDQLALLTMIFLLVKGACTFVPETVFLSTFFHNGSLSPNAVNPVSFYPALAILGVLISLTVGLVWVFSMRPYIRGMKRDPAMCEVLSEKMALHFPALVDATAKRRQRIFFLFLTLGFLFAIDLTIENSDLLPGVLSAVSFFTAFFFTEKKARAGKIFSLLYALASVGLAIATAIFFKDFKYTDIAYQDAALTHYIPVFVMSVLEAIFFFLTVLFALLALRDHILQNTGTLPAAKTFSRDALHKELTLGVRRLGVFSALYAVFRPVCVFLMTVTDRHVITESEANQFYSEGEAIYATTFSWLWIVILAVGIALTAYAASLFRDIKAESGLCDADRD